MTNHQADVKLFDHGVFGELRVVMKNGDPWFVARDVALALGYSDPAEAVRRHCKKSCNSNMGVSPAVPSPKIIPESDLYRLVMRSNLPSAERFQDWVCDEVIPSVRKHGGYLTPEMAEKVLTDPDTIIRLATDLKAERAKVAALESEVEASQPAIAFAASVECSDSDINVGELAKVLRQNGVEIGQNRLFDWLRDNGWMMRRNGQNVPTQKGMERGYFRIKEYVVSDGLNQIVRITPKVTGKGQVYFVSLFVGKS